MAIAFDQVGSGTSSASFGTVCTIANVAADAVLLAFLGTNNQMSATAMACNGVAMTKIGNAGAFFEVWALTAAPAGTLSISVQCGNTVARILTGITYTGVKDSGPFGTLVSATGTSVSTFNIAVSATVGNVVCVACRNNNSSVITNNNGTFRHYNSISSSHGIAAMIVLDEPGTAVVSLSVSAVSSGIWGGLGIPLLASIAETTSVPLMSLLGFGL